MNDAVRRDAREFGRHVTGGGWALALLVARNVDKGAGQGKRTDIEPLVAAAQKSGKVSIADFADEASKEGSVISRKRVTAHLAAWEKAAEAGVVPPADTLGPDEEVKLPKADKWDEFYEPVSGGFNGSPTRLAHNPGAFAQAFDSVPLEQKEMIAQEIAVRDDFIAAIESDPVVKETLLVALLGTPELRRQKREENQRKGIEKHAVLGWRPIIDAFGDANLGLSHALDALVKLAINRGINDEEDPLKLARARAEMIGRSIYEIEMAWGETPITDKIADLRGQPVL